LPWRLRSRTIAGLWRLRLVARWGWFGAIAGLLLGLWSVAWFWLWWRRSVAGTWSWRLWTWTILRLLLLSWGFVSRLRWRGRLVCWLCWFWWLVSRLGCLWWAVRWLCRRGRRTIVCRSWLACCISLLWRRRSLGWTRSVDNMDGWCVVRLVDQHRQLVVRQRNVLHCGGRRVFPSVSSVGIRRLWRWGEVDDGRLLSRVDDGPSILNLGPVGILWGAVRLGGRGSLICSNCTQEYAEQ